MLAKVRPLAGEAAKNHPLSDEEIVARVRAHDTALFEVLMRRHNRSLYRVVRAIVKDDGEAEDVMQQAYVSAFAHLDQFAGQAKFSTWLIRIAVNEAFSRMRLRRRFVDIDPAADQGEEMNAFPSSERGPEERAVAHELGGLLESAIEELPEIYRTVFMLREVEGLSTADTAECLELGEDAVKVRLHRAKDRLRNELYARVGTAAPEVFSFHATRCDRVVEAVFDKLEVLNLA